MPRVARNKGVYTTYHIVQRGNERKNIFNCDDDKSHFMDTLVRMKEKFNFTIEAYCLMDNHVHLVIDDNGNDISQIMKSINISYAHYFNKIYRRIGHLFHDRFSSEIIDNDRYLMTVSAYIHNNPVRAGMVTKPQEYRWSSMNAYLGRTDDIVRVERILECYSSTRKRAVQLYYDFVMKFEDDKAVVLDIDEDRLEVKRQSGIFIETLDGAKEKLTDELHKRNTSIEALRRDKDLRLEMMRLLRQNSSLTLREIGMICGGFAESTVSLILNGRKAKNRP